MPKAFVIYGHDRDVYREVTKFLTAMGIEVEPFHRVVGERNGLDSILPKVLNGIHAADVVIVLFTPDEQANFHDPKTGEYRRYEKGEFLGGWQPRPNVILEAGMAVASAPEKTILAQVGPIRVISDLSGVLRVDLERPGSKQELHDAIASKLGTMPPSNITLRGSVIKSRRPRWDDVHDELGELEARLKKIVLYGAAKNIVDLLRDYLTANPRPSSWNSTSIAHFIEHRDRRSNFEATNAVFWYLMIYGFFSFNDIDDGWDEEYHQMWWVNMLDFVHLTDRGRALLNKLQAVTIR